jgi:hypothetical protein
MMRYVYGQPSCPLGKETMKAQVKYSWKIASPYWRASSFIFVVLISHTILAGFSTAQQPTFSYPSFGFNSVVAAQVLSDNEIAMLEIRFPVLQQRTRIKDVTKYRTETRTRMATAGNGNQIEQTYTVQVPYTEQVEQTYTVPVSFQTERFPLNTVDFFDLSGKKLIERDVQALLLKPIPAIRLNEPLKGERPAEAIYAKILRPDLLFFYVNFSADVSPVPNDDLFDSPVPAPTSDSDPFGEPSVGSDPTFSPDVIGD